MSIKNTDHLLNGKRRSGSPMASDLPPTKKAKTLLDDEVTDKEPPNAVSTSHNDLGRADSLEFSINKEFARRFEHNKKREELDKLQEKYGKSETLNEDYASSESSSDEDEDDEGALATGALDAEFQKTLEAIQRKDPAVYDSTTKFYTEPIETTGDVSGSQVKGAKPMFLSDYHRKNLLESSTAADKLDIPSPTYVQQQEDLKKTIKEMHKQVDETTQGGEDEENDDDGFLIRKIPAADEVEGGNSHQTKVHLDVESAEKDPDAYLATFMSTRAWLPNEYSRFEAFESDDDEEERRADAFEEAYNLRFESTDNLNEKLVSHARDAVNKYSVRKESINPRRKARESERVKKEAEKRARQEEKARLRKLRVAELEQKILMIKDAAGLEGNILPDEDWSTLIDGAWDDVRWNELMRERFGEEYYKKSEDDTNHYEAKPVKGKIKKPKWKDDIEINDIIPDFEPNDNTDPTQFHLTNDEEASAPTDRIAKDEGSLKNKRRQMRLERRKVEDIVDEKLDIDDKLSQIGKKHAGHFRYRETSPVAWGLTASDILMADDSQLNQFAGLKKLAAFRDPEKKRKDKKHLGKKARLRQWRSETFGNEDGPHKTLADLLAPPTLTESDAHGTITKDADGGQRSKRKKRNNINHGS